MTALALIGGVVWVTSDLMAEVLTPPGRCERAFTLPEKLLVFMPLGLVAASLVYQVTSALGPAFRMSHRTISRMIFFAPIAVGAFAYAAFVVM